jgi:predicted nucleotidyltransferase
MLDKAVADEIEKLKNIMVATVPVEKIYLFGSYAYGTPHKDSDLDFYVVLKPGVNMRAIDAGIKIRLAISGAQEMPVDVLTNHHDVFWARTAAPCVEQKILREGRLLYG